MNAKNFLITGVSQGLGRAFAEAALAAGHRVAGTVRNSTHCCGGQRCSGPVTRTPDNGSRPLGAAPDGTVDFLALEANVPC
jgi:NAD(P)-dependent dehydrogenase (short-subunit alcohol dehydrogenase family)